MSAHTNPATPAIGKLIAEPSRSGGKIIDKWVFEVAAVGKTEGMKIPVDVSLVKGDEGLTFEAKAPGFSPFRNSDIEKLRQSISDRMREVSAVRQGLVWEDWLEVTLSCDDHEEGLGRSKASLGIEVREIKRAVDPISGQAYELRSDGAFAKPLPAPVSLKEALEKVEAQRAKHGLVLESTHERAFVPATPENVAALQDARDRLRLLRDRLAHALSQDLIQQTLGNMNQSLLALSSPGADTEDDQPSARRGPRP